MFARERIFSFCVRGLFFFGFERIGNPFFRKKLSRPPTTRVSFRFDYHSRSRICPRGMKGHGPEGSPGPHRARIGSIDVSPSGRGESSSIRRETYILLICMVAARRKPTSRYYWQNLNKIRKKSQRTADQNRIRYCRVAYFLAKRARHP